METSTNIKGLLTGNEIFVPSYQRAYSWDTSFDIKNSKQCNTFIYDLEDYIKSKSSTPYYFGHFLFEKKGEKYGVVDGQQRLTTITIFISALFETLRGKRLLSVEEEFLYNSVIKVGSSYRFSTVDYDDQLFKDYVINRITKDNRNYDTISQKRIIEAYDYFINNLAAKGEEELNILLKKICEAKCTTHVVESEAEAIQMFIFQNNRGKKPSNLEIIKAQFMYAIHLYGGSEEEKNELIKEIKNRFESIYKSITSIEHRINEDFVLGHTLKVYFNTLREINTLDKINENLCGENPTTFVKDFTKSLEDSFRCIRTFFAKETSNITIHATNIVVNHSIFMPFILKAIKNGVSDSDFEKMLSAIESISIRHAIIATRADLISRLNDIYKRFSSDVSIIINHLEWMKSQNGWWGYWNDTEFNRSLQGEINHHNAKILLWHYENYLITCVGKNGYAPIRYDSIKKPHLEHIAPQTPTNGDPIAHGYCNYDDDFKNNYLDCLGNYLLLSEPHNTSIGNIPFEEKRETYTQLKQQEEIRKITEEDHIWDKEKIEKRKMKIVDFILSHF